ncbi:cyclic-phosphate processing receiver domain-containing protein [Agromyces sp. NPDC057679]|uniref:cyclic-phosphate processing receiver domain-containing protein n=1 Tax=Agromyces sp. NPDC057679 TaxID=3346207 RepID=UPI00366D4DA7
MRKLWIDDLRPAPGEEWVIARTSAEAIAELERAAVAGIRFDEIGFDHDLGKLEDGTLDESKAVMYWLCENEDQWPAKIVIHTSNPEGRKWLRGTAKRYAPEGTIVIG